MNQLSIAQELVLIHLREAYKQHAKTYNLRSRERSFNIGDEVFVRNFTQSDASKKYNAKLAPKFVKAVIKNCIGKVAYEVVDINNRSLGVYHAKDILKS